MRSWRGIWDLRRGQGYDVVERVDPAVHEFREADPAEALQGAPDGGEVGGGRGVAA